MSDRTAPKPVVLGGIAAAAIALGVVVFRSPAHPAATEWTPADHDQPAGQAAPQQRQAPRAPSTQDDSASLAELAWSRNCAPCHGAKGRGDGPQGPMVRAPDLTRAEWQARVTDDDIRTVVKNGRNSMPKFDLPPAVLDGLVKRIRANKAP